MMANEAVENAWQTTTGGGESLNLMHQRMGGRWLSLLELRAEMKNLQVNVLTTYRGNVEYIDFCPEKAYN